MTLQGYLADVAQEMKNKSAAIRRDFLQHNLSAGENREHLVEKFLFSHLPKRFGVSTGFVISHDGEYSNQADLVVVDYQNNAPLYPDSMNKIWPVESVYALIEVKTNLHRRDIQDSISKCRRFKSLRRKFCSTGGGIQRTNNTLFVIWGFNSPDPVTLKANLVEELSDVPSVERPDLVVVPNRVVAKSGTYLETAKIGEPGSQYRHDLESRLSGDFSSVMPDCIEMDDFGESSLLAWYIWLDSWLRQAGDRFADPTTYLPPNHVFGTRI